MSGQILLPLGFADSCVRFSATELPPLNRDFRLANG